MDEAAPEKVRFDIDQVMAEIERYKKKPSCLNCEELNEHNVCYNPECSPVLLTKWRRKTK